MIISEFPGQLPACMCETAFSTKARNVTFLYHHLTVAGFLRLLLFLFNLSESSDILHSSMKDQFMILRRFFSVFLALFATLTLWNSSRSADAPKSNSGAGSLMGFTRE